MTKAAALFINAGDINNNGLDDIIVGAHRVNAPIGASFVEFGKTDHARLELSSIKNGYSGFEINDSSGMVIQ